MTSAASSDWQPLLPPGVAESTSFVAHGDEMLSLNWHRPATKPRARVLLCGAFGLERTYAYTTWKRLARAFAAAGFEAVTFDYLGTGESSGDHDDVTGTTCITDVVAVAKAIQGEGAFTAAGIPLVLVGFRAGALFAADAFAEAVGDALLMIDPAASMHAHLREVLRRKLAEDFADKGNTGPKRTRDQYVEELLEVGTLEVEGLNWNRALYEESQALKLKLPRESDARGVHVVHLDRRPESRHLIRGKSSVHPVPRPPFWGSDPLVRPDLHHVFDACVGFVADVVKGGPLANDAQATDAQATDAQATDAQATNAQATDAQATDAQATDTQIDVSGAVAQPASSASSHDCVNDDNERKSVASEVTQTREIIRLDVGDPFMVATVHLPAKTAAPASGVLLLNAGQVPREGHGRLSVELGDQLAERGHTVVRLDLPGLGDSPGELPLRCDTLWRFVEDGGQVASTLEALEALKRRFGIERWVVGGLCGAAVNAVFCAAQRSDLVSGLLLLEPELFLLEVSGANADVVAPEEEVSATARGVATVRKVVRKVRSTDSWLRLVTGDSRLGPRLKVFGKVLLPLLLSKAPVPDDLNRPLAIALAKTIAERVPTLCITARGQLRELYLDKALRAFAPGPRPAFEWERLDDTNHVFTSGGAKHTVEVEVARWLNGRAKFERRRNRAA